MIPSLIYKRDMPARSFARVLFFRASRRLIAAEKEKCAPPCIKFENQAKISSSNKMLKRRKEKR